MTTSRRLALWAAFLSLVLGVALTLHSRLGVASYTPAHPLTLLAPAPPPGWEVSDTLLGPTELTSGEAARFLNFDDYFYKTYRKGSMEVRVYLAYWTPGRMDPAQVAGHVPDVCWVGNGALMLERDDNRVLPGAGGRHLYPACFRVFQFPQGREEVVYWHCFGDSPIRYADLSDETDSPVEGRLRRYGKTLRLTLFGLAGREQMFVRISTNRTIDELVSCDLWPRLAASLLPSGIYRPAH